MNIAILSKGETLYSTQSLLKAGTKRKHVMEVLDPSHCSLSIENGKSVVRFHDEIVDDLVAIIPRIGASKTYYGATLVRHFNAMNVFSVVSAEAILQTRDKWTCSQLLSTFNVPIPKTILGSSSNLEYLLSNFKNKPVIIKILEGTLRSKRFITLESKNNPVYVIPDKTLDLSTVVVKVFENTSTSTFTTYSNIINATVINENSTLYILKEAGLLTEET